ncbi:hypothetical protein LSAT2_001873 [Lamellibrachia satsuma]|nr:hypothetical protein LSAT2_001873 [Lamellibrachia satsuma]
MHTLECCNGENPGIYILQSFVAVLLDHGQYAACPFDKICLADYNWILMPICCDNHWCLLAANVAKSTVMVLDSLENKERRDKYITLWQKYIDVRCKALGLPVKTWQEVFIQCTQQLDTHSCGVFTMMNAKAITIGLPPRVMRRSDVAAYREHVLQLLRSKQKDNESNTQVVCDLPFCTRPDLLINERKRPSERGAQFGRVVWFPVAQPFGYHECPLLVTTNPIHNPRATGANPNRRGELTLTLTK